MSRQDFWEQRYAGEDYLFGTAPNDFLAESAAYLVPGQRVLAVADGEGRNGVWLAERGLRVLSVDFAGNALAKARALAEARGVKIETQQADLFQWDWPSAAFDLVALFFVHPGPDDRRFLLNAMYHALKPGGLLILEAYAEGQADCEFGGPSDPSHCYSAAILREALPEARIISLEEKTIIRRSGRFPGKPAEVVRLLARRAG